MNLNSNLGENYNKKIVLFLSIIKNSMPNDLKLIFNNKNNNNDNLETLIRDKVSSSRNDNLNNSIFNDINESRNIDSERNISLIEENLFNIIS